MNQPRSKVEASLGWVLLFLLLLGCLFVLRPFLSALLWGVVLSVSCWPAYCRLLKLTGNRRTLASILMMLGMILIFLLPFVIVGLTLADNVTALTTASRKWVEAGPPVGCAPLMVSSRSREPRRSRQSRIQRWLPMD